MTIRYTGRVLWKNGAPVANAQVNLYEPYKGRKRGEELTAQPGLSDPDGNFTVEALESPYLDGDLLTEYEGLSSQFDMMDASVLNLGDELRPVLQFTYSLKGRKIKAQAPFRRLHRGYRLPHYPQVDFLPSRDGFAFANSFKPFDPPITLPDWLGISRIPGVYGLCGGMSSAAYDYCLARVTNPKADIRKFTQIPKTGTRLHRYLLRRSLDTFGPFSSKITKVGDWTMLPEQGIMGTQKQTLDEFPEICESLDEGQFVVLTLIYEHAEDMGELLKKIWNNHQVLAYGYTQTSPDTYEIQIYDSNYPNRDHAHLRVQRLPVGVNAGEPVYGLVTREIVPGERDIAVKGFFPMTYQAAQPPLP